MELFKIFPPLLLDLLSKFIPGSVFLFVFRNRYLPPTELVLQFFEPPSLSAEIRSYGSIGIFIASSYLVGVFIALAANTLDAWRNKSFWQPRIKLSPSDYIFPADQPPNFPAILGSPVSFVQFIEYSRLNVSASTPAIVFSLEKYRTVYRLFFALLVLSIIIPLYLAPPQALFALPAIPLFAWLSHVMQRRYMLKSIQLFALHERTKPIAKPKAAEE